MSIITKLTQKDFINISFFLLLRKRSIKVLIGIFFVFIISTAISLFSSKAQITTAIFPILFIAVLPLLTYFGAKRNYTSNQRISETIEYNFENEVLVIKGESFNSQLSWNKIYKVTKDKKWLLIWQNAQIANVIPTRDISQSQVEELKDILDRHKVKHNL